VSTPHTIYTFTFICGVAYKWSFLSLPEQHEEGPSTSGAQMNTVQ